MDQRTMGAMIDRAAEIGKKHGTAAASWVFDGNTPRETYEAFRRGLDDGDPEWEEKVPRADLSGEWADSFTARDLYTYVGVDDSDPDNDVLCDDICDAYSDAFDYAAHEEVQRMIAYQLDAR